MTPFVLGMATLLLCLAVLSFVRKGPARSETFSGVVPKFHIGWQSKVGPLRWVAFSPGGRSFCTVSLDGAVTVYSASGLKRYRTILPGVTRAVVTDDGRYAMAYSALDPANRSLIFLDSAGRVLWKVNAIGAVWSADVRGGPDGATFVAGTGERYVYVMELGRWRKRRRRWRAGGAVVSASIDSDGREVTYGTWQRSGVVRATLRGRVMWEAAAPAADLSYVEALRSSDRALVRSVSNRPGAGGEFALLDMDGQIVTQGGIVPSETFRVIAAPSGSFVCIGQNKLISHKGKSLIERHTVLLDSAGRTVCDKGSLFFEAEPLMVTSEGVVLLTSGKRALFTMTPSGRLATAVKVPARVERCYPSRDSDRALIQCAGGRLCMLSLRL